MILEFALGEHLHERICHIVICGHSFNFHIIMCYYLSNQMITPEYMLRSLMRPLFLCLCNGSIVVTINSYWFNNKGNTSSSTMTLCFQTASFATSEAAIYYASVVESAIIDFLKLFQLTAPLFSRKMNPE